MAAPMPPAPVGLKLTQAPNPTVVVEMFHDVCCPFSKKMYDTVDGGVLPALADKGLSDQIDFVWQSVPQPWHAQSCLMHVAAWGTSPKCTSGRSSTTVAATCM